MRVHVKVLLFLFLLSSLVYLSSMPGMTQTPDQQLAPPAVAAPAAPGGDTTQPGGAGPGPRGSGGVDQPVFPVAAPTGPVDPDATVVSISFAKADVSDVLAFLSMASGVPIVLDADVRGNVSIISVKQVTLTSAYDVIESALRARGYTMVGTLKDKIIRVVTLKRAISESKDVRVGAEAAQTGSSDSMVTQIIPLQFLSAAKLKDEIKPLVADDQASLIAASDSNALIVTDTEGNIKRLQQIVALLDKDTSDVLEVEVYVCKNAGAAALVNSLSQLFNITKPGQPAATAQAAGGGGGGRQGGMPGGGAPGGADQSTPSAVASSALLNLKGELHITSDDRTNAVIIAATRQKITMVLDLVKKLDVDTAPQVTAKVFVLKNADASLTASQLNQMFVQPTASSTTSPFAMMRGGGAAASPATAPGKDYAGMKQNVVVADLRTNSIIVTATDGNMRMYEDMIKSMDKETALGEITRAFPLHYATAATLATTLTTLFRGSTTQSRSSFFDLFSGNNSANQNGNPLTTLQNITLVAETKSNTLLVTGPPQVMSMVESIINRLDQRQLQVYIEVAIVDVTLDDSDKFGLEWSFNSTGKSTNASTGVTGATNTVGTQGGLGLNPSTDALPGGLQYSIISNNMQALLRAISARTNVKVYSTPSITTANNVQANISIGSSQPYVSTSQDNSSGNPVLTVAYQPVNISLTVTPHVNISSDMITDRRDALIGLDVLQTINELDGTAVLGNLSSPIVATRSATTTVMVNDGQTIVIGGMIQDHKEKDINAVPVLSKIPLLGELFKSRTNVSTKTELMVFLTPHILLDNNDVTDTLKAQIQKIGERPENLPAVLQQTDPTKKTTVTTPTVQPISTKGDTTRK